MPYHYKTYHLFDIGGMYIDTFIGIKAIAKKTGIPEGAVSGAFKRQGCLYGKYYVSIDRNFNINEHLGKSCFNPILSKNLGESPKFGVQDTVKIYREIDEFFRNCEDLDYLTDNCY